MSLLVNQTSANAVESFFVKANAQVLNSSTINANTISAGQIVSGLVSSSVLDANDINASTIFAYEVFIDNQGLTATPTELLLNGIPLATTSNISSLSDWALDPAISTVQMNGNNILGASTISCITINANQGLFAANINAGNGLFQNLVAFNSLFVSSNTSTISSLILNAELGNFSTGKFGNATISTTLDFTPDPSTVIFMDAQPSTFTIGQQVNTLIGNQITLDAQNGITLDSSLPVYVPNVLSTPALYISSINGAEFTSTTITVELGQFSSIATQSISSLGAEIRQALMSSIVFSPSLNPSLGGVNVNLGLGGLLGNIVGWGAGVFGAAAGTVGLITGMTALATGRQTQNINNNYYETVNGTTQIQFSTLGTPFSTIYRFNNSADPQTIPGEEILVSTIYPPGIAVRSVSDPLYTLSTPNSTIQAFGQWVAVPESNPSSISTVQDWAEFPALSSVSFAVGVPAVVQSGQPTDNIALKGANIQLVGDYTDAKDLLLVSTLSAATLLGANDNLFANFLSTPGLKIDAPNLFLSTPNVIHPGFFNGSTIAANSASIRELTASTINSSTLTTGVVSTGAVLCSTGAILCNGLAANTVSTREVVITGGPSTLTISTAVAAGAQGQPAGRFLFNGNDVDLGQQDLWVQQIRLGAGNATNAQSEIIFYDANANTRALNTGLLDRTIRVISTPNGTTGGYLLDTAINAPFFSTINAGTSTAMMAWFPSTVNSTIGISTLSVIPNPIFVAQSRSLSSQKVLASNTPLALNLGATDVNIGGYILTASTLTVPVAGTYTFAPSLQFNTTSGGAQVVDFWFTKNGTDVPNSASKISVANNAQAVGTVIFQNTAAAGDQFGIKIASSDANMEIGFFQSTIAPYARPAVPSIILNAQRIA